MAVNDPQQTQWKITVSELGLDDLSNRLIEWISPRLGADAPVRISHIERPDAGMSGATVLFDAEWTDAGALRSGSYVMRMPPASIPLMRTYDLEKQYEVMRAVADSGAVPVPELCWQETDETALGTPFFIMRKVDGRIPSDNPPYVFMGWILESAPDERLSLMHNTVDVLAKLHAIADAQQRFPMLCADGSGLRCHVEETRAWYRWGLADEGHPVPLIERGFDWLEANWPADPGPDVLSWGDSRPANIIYDGVEPAAVIDWEMAALGPREIDVAWIIYMHAFFQFLATMHGAPGLPDFLRRDDVVARYEEASESTLRNLDFYLVYAGIRHAIAMARGKVRMIGFGEDVAPQDPDDYIMQRPLLTALLEGKHKWE
ncbi:phosphotransferase family protein [Nocardia sp. CA-120079]|uniref:phosphotransferase family protein n=1 Tax=Nocardia sp. CA-120079 TaxID=3239974 RepID=UPI003D968E97